MDFRYAIFDMDGLMFDTERLYVDSFLKCVSVKTGVDFPEDKLISLIGYNYKDTLRVFPELFDTDYSCDECFEIGNNWIKEYIQENGVPIKPGLTDLLTWLKENGYKIAVASSTYREKVAHYIEMSNLLPYFDVIMGGDMVTKGKPDPQIFLMAAESLGCTNPSECVVFEDSKNGLLAGYAAGMSVIIVPDLMDPTIEHPDYAFAKIKVLSDAIPLLTEIKEANN